MFKFETTPATQEIIQRCCDTYTCANPFRYTDPQRYSQILGEFYGSETKRRLQNLVMIEQDPELIHVTKQFVSKREHFIDWIVDWCWTYDPRLATFNLETFFPIIVFPNQIEGLEWIYNRYLNQERSIIDKTRESGVTWLFVLFMLFEWRWTRGFAGGIGSNKLDNVDDSKNPDCIFEKIRMLLAAMPDFWMPDGYSSKYCEKLGSLFNPEMGSYLTGQGGKNIGRGGRRSAYLVDESAFLEFPVKTEAALSANTNCEFNLSTPNGMNHFGQKRKNGKVPVYTFRWQDDPRKDEQWYKKQCDELDPVVVKQEIDIDYLASVEGIFIKPEWVDAAVELDLEPVGERGAGLDVAAGGTNKSSLANRYGPVVRVKAMDISNGIDLTHEAIDICNKAGSDYLNYDIIGVGYAVTSTVERTEKEFDFPVFGVNVGEPPSDNRYKEFKNRPAKEIFLNIRSEIWYLLARRFEKTWEYVNGIRKYPHEELISIPDNNTLRTQLSSPKKMWTETGKMKCESKDMMLKRGIISPDEADSVGLAFVPKGAGKKHIAGDIPNDILQNIKVDWNQPGFRIMHYGAIVLNKDMSIDCLCAVYDSEAVKLMIYDELHLEMINIEDIVSTLKMKMNLGVLPVNKMIGNKPMFEDFKKTVQKELNNSFMNAVGNHQTIRVKPSRKYDQFGSIAVLGMLMKKKQIVIDKKCQEAYSQFITWRLEHGKVDCVGMKEALLLIVSELMHYEPFVKKVMKKPEYSATLTGHVEKQINSTGDPLAV